MQIVSDGDNLHGMSNYVFWGEKEKYFKLSSAENFPESAKRLKNAPIISWRELVQMKKYIYHTIMCSA